MRVCGGQVKSQLLRGVAGQVMGSFGVADVQVEDFVDSTGGQQVRRTPDTLEPEPRTPTLSSDTRNSAIDLEPNPSSRKPQP